MSNATINFRTDSDFKKRIQGKLDTMGLDMTTALNLFLTQVDINNSIPFEVKTPTIKYKSPRTSLKGLLKEKVVIHDDFNDPISDMEDYM